MTSRALILAALMVIVAMTLIVTGDTAGKLMTADGIAPVFVAWSRFALAAVLLLPFSGLSRAELPMLADRRLFLRAALIAGTICSILTALKTEPIANVFGAFFVGPLVSYLLSALILGERISKGRTLLLLTGFAGVVLVVKPGFGMTLGLGFALLAGLLYGCFLVMTRVLAGTTRPRLLLQSQLLIGAVILAPLGLAFLPEALDGRLAGLIAISAGASAIGNYLLVLANRTTPASVIAPLVYSQIVAATVIGLLVFSDWPDAVSLAGLATIVASGIGSLWLTRRGT